MPAQHTPPIDIELLSAGGGEFHLITRFHQIRRFRTWYHWTATSLPQRGSPTQVASPSAAGVVVGGGACLALLGPVSSDWGSTGLWGTKGAVSLDGRVVVLRCVGCAARISTERALDAKERTRTAARKRQLGVVFRCAIAVDDGVRVSFFPWTGGFQKPKSGCC